MRLYAAGMGAPVKLPKPRPKTRVGSRSTSVERRRIVSFTWSAEVARPMSAIGSRDPRRPTRARWEPLRPGTAGADSALTAKATSGSPTGLVTRSGWSHYSKGDRSGEGAGNFDPLIARALVERRVDPEFKVFESLRIAPRPITVAASIEE